MTAQVPSPIGWFAAELLVKEVPNAPQLLGVVDEAVVGMPAGADDAQAAPAVPWRAFDAAVYGPGLCDCGKPAAHLAADPDGPDWACRVPDALKDPGRGLNVTVAATSVNSTVCPDCRFIGGTHDAACSAVDVVCEECARPWPCPEAPLHDALFGFRQGWRLGRADRDLIIAAYDALRQQVTG